MLLGSVLIARSTPGHGICELTELVQINARVDGGRLQAVVAQHLPDLQAAARSRRASRTEGVCQQPVGAEPP